MRAVVLLLLCSLGGMAQDLDSYLRSLSVEARVDTKGFAARLSAHFGVGPAQVQAVLGTVKEPGDAFLVFQLSQMSGLPRERVMEVYKGHHAKGWGAMAKELGIKPGSREFKALKRGELRLGPGREHPVDNHPGKGHGRKGKH